MHEPIPPIGVFYEHDEWFEPMFREFERRGVAFERLLAHEHHFDPLDREHHYSLLVNRVSPSAFTRGRPHVIPYTLEYLAHLDAIGANVLNGLEAYRFEFSKARQTRLMAGLGIRHPRSRVIQRAAQALAASEGLRFPVIVKPNVGGSGAGIRRFETRADLADAAAADAIDLGLDHVALVQEHVPPRDAAIVRVEVMNGRFLYAIRLRLQSPDSFNLCPADYCVPGAEPAGTGASEGPPRMVEGVTPPPQAIETVLRLTRAAGIEVGGVEYLVDDRDGEITYYDINALSNFVADAPNVVGFDPFVRLVDFVLERAGMRQAVA
jgi:hypothetical protein